MCGISGFITRDLDQCHAEPGWLVDLASRVSACRPGAEADLELRAVLSELETHFAQLMSVGMIAAVAEDDVLAATIGDMANRFARFESELAALSQAGQTALDPVIEGLRDYGWQLSAELVDHARAARALAGSHPQGGTALRVAIATEYVLRSIDKLEVRGRDSAGIAVQLSLDSAAADRHADAVKARLGDLHGGHASVYRDAATDGSVSLTFVYKTANLVGQLGDNGSALRASIKADALFWTVCADALRTSILSHTRWASHGVISVANCHPHNPSLAGDTDASAADIALGAMYVLNGDVDNHLDLEQELVTSRQLQVHPDITTDAKIIPITHRNYVGAGTDPLDRFRMAMRRLDGSVAIGAIMPEEPGVTYLAQKGSGQGLHAARLVDGWMFASEAYGLCNAARTSYNLARSVAGGSVIRLDAQAETPEARTVSDGTPAVLKPGPIQIFARDIYRGDYQFFLEKEIHEGAASVRKTLKGRFRRDGSMIAFDDLPTDIWKDLRGALRKGIKRIYVIGQGTAGVAAVGIGELIERALSRDARVRVPVMSVRSSELSADIDSYDFERSLVIAVSQSGTTTDTNRAVDLARERGAFVHGIVNRRNSDLVRKSDSVLFTSDGRDVEMSVASTKAFYSQITAGKLTALFIAEQLQAMTEVELAYEMGELEKLPGHIDAILANEAHIAECARALAPYARYWAVTGSGINHIAALEIRIKLSELCYKSIPVDYTEDKKHIDLSTEPLTLVIANDLPADLVGDVVKETAIFKAHNGRPVVFATEGHDAKAFESYAERVIALPKVGADLAFVLATVAGHLFGLHAARAIDEGAQKLKTINMALALTAMGDPGADTNGLIDALEGFVAEAADGPFNSGLSASDLAHCAVLASQLRAAPDDAQRKTIAASAQAAMQKVFEETSRPIDTIRHQAKTVTVGTSRPEDALSVPVRDALAGLGLADSRMGADTRKALAALSRLTENVVWAGLLDIDGKRLTASASTELPDALSAFRDGGDALGVLGAALDSNALQTGFMHSDAVIVAPVTGTETAGTAHLLCLGVTMIPHATREQKIAVMSALETLKPKLREWEQVHGADAEAALHRAVASVDPMTVAFRPQALDPMAMSSEQKTA